MPDSHLTTDELAKAVRLNAVWFPKLWTKGAWPTHRTMPDLRNEPAEFALEVAEFQASYGLHVDGILGPITAASMHNGPLVTRLSDSLILRGLRVPVDAKVLDWIETGLSFGKGNGLLRKRVDPISMGILHTTGGEHSGHTVWNTLVYRNLSVDFLLDSNGTIYQYNDPAVSATAHAGWTNSVSWGIEITNDIDPARGKVERPDVRGTLRGSSHVWDGLLPAQKAPLVALITVLCETFNVPKLVPGRNGKVLDGAPVPQELLAAYYKAKKQGARFEQKKLMNTALRIMQPLLSGCVAGHFHVSLSKPDPSPDVFDALLEAGFALKEV